MVKNCTNFALSFYAVYKNPHILFDIIQHILPHCKRWGGRAQKISPFRHYRQKRDTKFLSSIRFAPKDHTFCRLSAAHTGIAQMLLIVGDTS